MTNYRRCNFSVNNIALTVVSCDFIFTKSERLLNIQSYHLNECIEIAANIE